MNLTLVFGRKYRWPEHYFSVRCLGNSQKLLTTNQFLVSTIFFTIMNIFFFQSVFWSLFNHRQKSRSNQEQCSLCCCSPCFLVLLCTHDGPLQCFSTYFRKLKEMGVLRPIFPDHVISCDYDLMNLDSTSICDIIYLQFTVFSVKISIATSKVDKLQFSCKIASYGKSLVTIFQEIFTSIEKIFILGGRLSTRLYNSINF